MAANNQSTSAPARDAFIVRFYGKGAVDGQGRSHDQILKFDDDELERYHDFIQLPERSAINPSAHIITEAVRDVFAEIELLRDRLFGSFVRIASFYAFNVSGTKEDPTLTPKPGFEKLARKTWRTHMDHNHLRITRIIRCLRILRLEKTAFTFYDALLANKGDAVSGRSLMYWDRAAKRPLHLPPDESNVDATGIEWLRRGS